MSATRTVILTLVVAFVAICTQVEAGGGQYQYSGQIGKTQVAPSQYTQAQYTQQATQQYSQPKYRGGYRMSNRASTNVNIYNFGHGNYNNVNVRTGMSNRAYSSRRTYYYGY